MSCCTPGTSQFFFLSGWLWSTGPTRTVRDEIGRRAKTLLKPYAFWWLVLILPFLIVMFVTDDVTFRNVAAPFYGGGSVGRPYTTFWFVFALFASAVLWRLLDRTSWWIRMAVIVTGVLATIWIGPVLSLTPLAIGVALPALAFVGAGQIARKAPFRHAWQKAVVGVALLAVSGVLVATRMAAPLDIKGGEWGTPVLSIAVATAISWGLVLLAESVGGRMGPAGAACTWFALAGFTIVLVHPAVLWVAEPFLPGWAVFVLAVAVPLVVGRAALRTPVSQWVTGLPQQIGISSHARAVR